MSSAGDGGKKQIAVPEIRTDAGDARPYSKGLMTNSMVASGLPPTRAYQVALAIEDRLLGSKRTAMTAAELRRLAAETIREIAGERAARAYTNWQAVRNLDLPLIVLLGGGTGAGKSTVATQLAARLGIVRIISTDAIREVMKAMFTSEIMPTLGVSSFNADEVVRPKLGKSEDALIVGFRDQVAAVAVGVQALIDRSVMEGTDVIIEGAHLAPGFVSPPAARQAAFVHLVLTVDDEEIHRNRFLLRSQLTRARPMERYLPSFGNIRKIQKYIKTLALERGVPIIQNHNLDTALSSVIEHITAAAAEAAKGRARTRIRAVRGEAQ